MSSDAALIAQLERLERKVDMLLTSCRTRIEPGAFDAAAFATLVRDELKPLRRCARLSVADAALLAKLLPAIAAGAGQRGRTFGAGEAMRDIAMRDTGLWDELARQLGPEGDGRAKRLGNLLGRAAGKYVCGFRVEKTGASGGSALWMLVSKPLSNPKTHTDP